MFKQNSGASRRGIESRCLKFKSRLSSPGLDARHKAGHDEKENGVQAPYASTSSTSSIVISTGLSPRSNRPTLRPPV